MSPAVGVENSAPRQDECSSPRASLISQRKTTGSRFRRNLAACFHSRDPDCMGRGRGLAWYPTRVERASAMSIVWLEVLLATLDRVIMSARSESKTTIPLLRASSVGGTTFRDAGA